MHDQVRYFVSAIRNPSHDMTGRQRPDTKGAVSVMKKDMYICVCSCEWQNRLD